jgi:hypothetical protein
MSKTKVNLNASQVLILQTLAKFPDGLSTEVLATKSGATVNSGNLGPVFKLTLGNYPDSLFGLGYVKPNQYEEGPVLWTITPKGQKQAGVLVTKKKYTGVKIPGKVLDAQVIKFMKVRTYGLELYTLDDLKEIRTACGEEYKDVPLEELKQQIVNRRKQGAYADPQATTNRLVAAILKAIGEEGTLGKILTKEQITKLEKLVVV